MRQLAGVCDSFMSLFDSQVTALDAVTSPYLAGAVTALDEKKDEMLSTLEALSDVFEGLSRSLSLFICDVPWALFDVRIVHRIFLGSLSYLVG